MWQAGIAGCTKGPQAALFLVRCPPESTLETQNNYSNLGSLTCARKYMVPYCGAVPAWHKQDVTARVKSHIGKSVFCSVKFCRREWKSYFLAELNMYFTFQHWVSKVAVERWCSSSVVIVYSHFFSPCVFWPLLMSGWMQTGQELGKGTWSTKALNPCLNSEALWQCFGQYGWLVAKTASWCLEGGPVLFLLNFPYFQRAEPMGQHTTAGHHLSGGRFCKWLTHSWSTPAAKWHAVLPFLSKVKNIIDYGPNTAPSVQNKRHSWAFQEPKRYPSITSHSYLCVSDFHTWLQYGLLKDLVLFFLG